VIVIMHERIQLRALRFLLFAASMVGCGACGRASPPATVITYTSPMWYEETGRYFQVSRDGRRAIYGTGPRS